MLVIAPFRGHSNDLSFPGLNLACSCLGKVWGLQSGCLPAFSWELGELISVRSGFPQSTQTGNSTGRKPSLLGGGKGQGFEAWNVAPLLDFPEVELTEASPPVLCLCRGCGLAAQSQPELCSPFAAHRITGAASHPLKTFPGLSSLCKLLAASTNCIRARRSKASHGG